MNLSEEYQNLTTKLSDILPIKAYPIRELVQVFRKNGQPITLKTELMITSLFNSGDISGIMCIIETKDGKKLACALTHLIIPKSFSLYPEIIEYQRKREKRIKQLHLKGLN